MITLIIVDCQNDFITGSFLVKGAKKVLGNIKEFIKKNCKRLDKIIFAVDWHPYNHCSFKKFGGEYPVHCIQFTPGACIEPKLLKLVQSLNIQYEVSIKGDYREKDQVGAFEEIELSADDYPKRKYYFDSIATADVNTEFVICGMTGDYCIKETINNLITKGEIIPKIFLKGIASTDNGVIINNCIKEHKLEII